MMEAEIELETDKEIDIITKVFAAFSYLGILCFIPLMMNRNSQYIYFHARQGLIIWMWSVLSVIMLYIPGVGKWIFSSSAFPILILSAIGLTSVFLGKQWKIPFIHTLSTKL